MSKTLHSFNGAKHLAGQSRNSLPSGGGYLNSAMKAVVMGFLSLSEGRKAREAGEEDDRHKAHVIMTPDGELQVEITDVDFVPAEGSVFVMEDCARFTAEEVHQFMAAKLAGSYYETVNGKPSGAMFKPLVFGMFAIGSWYQCKDGQWVLASDVIGNDDNMTMVDQYNVQRYCYGEQAGQVFGLNREAIVGGYWPGDIVASRVTTYAEDELQKGLQGAALIAQTEAAEIEAARAAAQAGALAGVADPALAEGPADEQEVEDGQAMLMQSSAGTDSGRMDSAVENKAQEPGSIDPAPESVGSESLKNGMENFGGIGGGA